jgi:Tol biopolymer transport system component
VIAAQGGTPRRMITSAADEHRPNWSLDGASIYFSSTESGRSEVWRVSFGSGGPAAQVTTAGGYEGREGRNGRMHPGDCDAVSDCRTPRGFIFLTPTMR